VYLRGHWVQALDAQTGDDVWSVAVGGCSPVTIAGDYVYVVGGMDHNGVFVYRADTGRQISAYPLLSSCHAFVVAGQMGYLSTQEGVLHAIPVGGHVHDDSVKERGRDV